MGAVLGYLDFEGHVILCFLLVRRCEETRRPMQKVRACVLSVFVGVGAERWARHCTVISLSNS
jgi:hypothetical protein